MSEKKKTRWWVVLLVAFGVIALIGILGVVGVVWWFSANKDRLLAAGKEGTAEAATYAASHDQSACVDEGLRRVAMCDGIMCEAKEKIFTTACVQNATPSTGFCDNVPPANAIMEVARWSVDECERRRQSARDQRCHRLVQAVPAACEARRTASDHSQ